MSRARTWFRENPYLSTVICSLLVLSLRSWRRLLQMEIWAEDGTHYLSDALTMGFDSIGVIYGGFYHVIQRFLMVVFTHVLPMTWLAAAVNLTYMLIYAAVIAIPVRRDYEWILPSLRARFALCFLFCLVPGVNEMMGNYANLPWVLFFYLAFLGLRDPHLPIRIWELALSIGVIASIGQALFAIPLFAWRTNEGMKKRGLRQTWTNAAMLSALVLATITLWFVREPEFAAVPHEAPGYLFQIFVKTTIDSLLVGLLGDRTVITVTAMTTPVPRLIGIAVMLSLLGAGVLKFIRKREGRAVFLLVASVLIWPAVSWFARPGNLWVFAMPFNGIVVTMRYAFPSGIVASLLWMFLLHASPLKQSWKNFLSIFMAVLALSIGGSRFWIKEYGAERRWEQLAPKVDAALRDGCPNPVRGAIYPNGWYFHHWDPDHSLC